MTIAKKIILSIILNFGGNFNDERATKKEMDRAGQGRSQTKFKW